MVYGFIYPLQFDAGNQAWRRFSERLSPRLFLSKYTISAAMDGDYTPFKLVYNPHEYYSYIMFYLP
jgi:hypothetical protein